MANRLTISTLDSTDLFDYVVVPCQDVFG